MQIRILQNVQVPMMPEFIQGNSYDVDEELANTLISRGFAEFVINSSKLSKTKVSKKS